MLCRGKNESATLDELKHAFAEAEQALGEQLAEDQEFWASCPVLTGDWPDAWRRGWVYDYIFVERLWRAVKYEEVYFHDYRTVSEARYRLENYFHFYHTERMERRSHAMHKKNIQGDFYSAPCGYSNLC